MRAIFFGTPRIAVPALHALSEVASIVGVVCQPERPAGRGLALRPHAVQIATAELGFELYQPLRVRSGELEAWVRERTPDLALVLAYGRILPRGVLDAPPLGCLNLHASLLPKYRGAAPIRWAILRGESETGISLMQMEEELDAGPVFSRRALPIGPDETGDELEERLAELAAHVVREDLPRVFQGELRAVLQDASQATFAPPLEPMHARIDWSEPARTLHDQVRGLAERPGAYTSVGGKRLRVLSTRVGQGAVAEDAELAPGVLDLHGDALVVGTGRGPLEILRAQLEGKKALAARDLVNGRLLRAGMLLGT